MSQKKMRSRIEQATDMLRQGMLSGRWRGTLPGRLRLAEQLDCSHGTVEVALSILAKEGWLISQGQGRRRRIQIPAGQTKALRQIKRVRILAYDNLSLLSNPAEVGLLVRLLEVGYAADFAMKSLQDLNMDVKKVAHFVNSSSCDAWIVPAGSREILQWFSEQSTPAIALYGRFMDVPIAAASPRKTPSMVRAVRRLAELGHRHIVLTTTPERIEHLPGVFEQVFLDELKALGLSAGPYNLAAVDKASGGLQGCLTQLFRLTPPSAIIIGDSEHVMATQQFLARRGLRVPEDVSLISTDFEPEYIWCEPLISHIDWDASPIIRYVLRWLDRVTQGKKDTRQKLFDTKFVEGGTIGPVSKKADMSNF